MVILFFDYSLRIWPLTTHRDDERFTVSHSEEITCFVLTVDSLHVITGSRDMSLKVWHIIGGKLTQVILYTSVINILFVKFGKNIVEVCYYLYYTV